MQERYFDDEVYYDFEGQPEYYFDEDEFDSEVYPFDFEDIQAEMFDSMSPEEMEFIKRAWKKYGKKYARKYGKKYLRKYGTRALTLAGAGIGAKIGNPKLGAYIGKTLGRQLIDKRFKRGTNARPISRMLPPNRMAALPPPNPLAGLDRNALISLLQQMTVRESEMFLPEDYYDDDEDYFLDSDYGRSMVEQEGGYDEDFGMSEAKRRSRKRRRRCYCVPRKRRYPRKW